MKNVLSIGISRIVFVSCLLGLCSVASADVSYFSWRETAFGGTHCYQFLNNGTVLNNGKPMNDSICETAPTFHYERKQAARGGSLCYKFTNDGKILNNANPVANSECDEKSNGAETASYVDRDCRAKLVALENLVGKQNPGVRSSETLLKSIQDIILAAPVGSNAAGRLRAPAK